VFQKHWSQAQWLAPIILTTWEAEIGRIEVQGWLIFMDKKPAVMEHPCHPSYNGKLKIEGS
jgi:hypothetical protein